MKKHNKGSVMIWILVVLFALSLLLVSYAKVVHNDYNISLSIYRQHVALQNSYAGIAIARDYYTTNPDDLYNSFLALNNNETEELYPAGILFSESSLITDYSIEKIYLEKDYEGTLYIYTESKHVNAVSKIRIEVTDIYSGTYGAIEKLN